MFLRIQSKYSYCFFILIITLLPVVSSLADKPDIPNGVYLGAIIKTGKTPRSYNYNLAKKSALFMEFFRFPDILTNQNEKDKITSFINSCLGSHAIPSLTLESYRTDLNDSDVLNNYTIDQINTLADYLDSFGVPMFLRWNHEMNGSWHDWSHKPSLYVQKFDEFAAIIHARAPNVAMVWAPNEASDYPFDVSDMTPGIYFDEMDTNGDGQITSSDDPYSPWYPADISVDWVGLSVYHWGKVNNQPGFNVKPSAGDFDKAMGYTGNLVNFHDTYSTSTQPMMIAETAALFIHSLWDINDDWNHHVKEEWLSQIFHGSNASKYPNLKAVFWFNEEKYEGNVHGDDKFVDWRLWGDPFLVFSYINATNSSFYIQGPPTPYEYVKNLSAPDSVITSEGSFDISFDYETQAETRDIRLDILDASTYESVFSEEFDNVTGNGSETVNVSIAPESGDYLIKVIIMPVNGAWVEAIHSDQRALKITNDNPFNDRIKLIDFPEKLARGDTVELTIEYEATQALFLQLALLYPENNYETVVGKVLEGTNKIQPGRGTIKIELTIPTTAILTNTYIWDCYMSVLKHDWEHPASNKPQIHGVEIVAQSFSSPSVNHQTRHFIQGEEFETVAGNNMTSRGYIPGTTVSTIGGYDDGTQSVSVGFDFSFYGNTYSTVNICTNGFINFGSSSTSWSNVDLPNSNSPNNTIAPFWDDLKPSAGGDMYYSTIGIAPNRTFIVEWRNVPHYGSAYTSTTDYSFEVHLQETTNSIRFVYGDMVGAFNKGSSATIGIENGSGTACVKYSYNKELVDQYTSLSFLTSDGGITYELDVGYVSPTTIAAGLSGKDDATQSVPLGFNFPFYGTNYSTVNICTNGFINFGAGSSSYDNQAMPNASTPNNVIAPFWDNIDLFYGGNVYYDTIGTSPNRIFIGEWRNVTHYDSSDSDYTFEVQLYEGSNDIKFLYGPMTGDFADGSSATMGIENGAGTAAELQSYNKPLVVTSRNTDIKTPNGGASFDTSTRVDVEQLNHPNGPYFVDQWQSYTANGPNSLAAISVYGRIRSASTLYIYEGDGITGPLLHSQALPVNTTNQWITFDLDNAVIQKAEQKYTFRIVAGSSTTNALWWDYDTSYLRGSFNANYWGGGYSTDMAFKIHVFDE